LLARGRVALKHGHSEVGADRLCEGGLASRGDERADEGETRREFRGAVGDELLFERAHHLHARVVHATSE